LTWKGSQVAHDRTHHITVDGKPLYEQLFDHVLAFHEPGLAPVLDATGAYHIHPDGRPAYEARFKRTFGFYEGQAAVRTDDGSYHILPDGTPLYKARWAWCGNYQKGRCVVHDAQGNYYHLRLDGRVVPGGPWAYAGDHREGSAVVMDKDGACFHVDPDGSKLNAQAFLDLDVYHKGFARARDALGWFFIDPEGNDVGGHRFTMLEPFYNGQARAENLEGELVIIDEEGVQQRVLRKAELRTSGARTKTWYRPADTIELESAHETLKGALGADAYEHLAPSELVSEYKVFWEHELHRGSLGAVYPAMARTDDKSLVVKSTRGLNLHHNEVEVLKLLHGTGRVPRLKTTLTNERTGYIVMERCKGGPIGSRSGCEPYPVPMAVEMISAILDILDVMHSNNYLHTDINPMNILMDRREGVGSLRMVDFELSVKLDESRRWRGEVYWGLWEFIPPEQFDIFTELTEATDTYLAGALFYYLLKGRPPFYLKLDRSTGSTWHSIKSRYLKLRDAPLDNTGIPRELQSIIGRALNLEPKDRYRTTKGLRKDLESGVSTSEGGV